MCAPYIPYITVQKYQIYQIIQFENKLKLYCVKDIHIYIQL